jgi:hypothetical protein
VQVDEIAGGITNVLLKLTPPKANGAVPVAMRVFGDKTDLIIDREREIKVLLQLNRAGFGAPVRRRLVHSCPLPEIKPCLFRRGSRIPSHLSSFGRCWALFRMAGSKRSST